MKLEPYLPEFEPSRFFWKVYSGSPHNEAWWAAVRELLSQHAPHIGVDPMHASASICQFLVDRGHVTEEHIMAIMALCKAADNRER